jgi:hypothetical protein
MRLSKPSPMREVDFIHALNKYKSANPSAQVTSAVVSASDFASLLGYWRLQKRWFDQDKPRISGVEIFPETNMPSNLVAFQSQDWALLAIAYLSEDDRLAQCEEDTRG